MATYYIEAAGADTNAGTSAGAGNAWLTLGKATATVAAGDKVNVKNDQTYNEILTLATSGGQGTPIIWEGYTTSVGDGGRALIEGGNTRATCIDLADKVRNVFCNFTLQGATTRIVGWSALVTPHFFVNCRILKGAGSPASFAQTANFDTPALYFTGCEIANFTGAGVPATIICAFDYCEIHDNGGAGLAPTALRGLTNSLIYDNAGDGVFMGSFTLDPYTLIAGNTFNNNGGDAIDLDGDSNGIITITNNIFTGSGGYNIKITNAVASSAVATAFEVNRNFYIAGSSGHINNTARVIQCAADVLLTGDPFTNAGSDDYSLDSTASEGAAVRAAAFGNVFPGGTTTGYRAGGAVEPQAAGGSGGGLKLVGAGGLVG